MQRTIHLSCLVLVLSIHPAFGQTTFPAFHVAQNGGRWVITSPSRTLSLDSADMRVAISAGGAMWNMLPSAANDVTVEMGGKRTTLRFSDARKSQISPWQTGFSAGIRIALSDFQKGNQEFDCALRLFITIEQNAEDVIFELVPAEGQTRIKECLWPKAFDPAAVDFTVVPFMQGMLLPCDWPRRVHLYDSLSYGRGLYMPWWGQMRGASAAMLILETPPDGGCRFEHPANGPTTIQTRWLHSLGTLSYPRRARVCFIDKGGYVEMAKRYRRHVIESGHVVSLKEKIARSPLVGRVAGSPVIHTSILSHIQPESSYFNKTDPVKNHQLVTFETRIQQLRRLSEKGVHRAYLHLDGWGLRGYDNLHPDILPPSPEAGGWDGFKRLGDVCDELGYVFAVHDQYRDFYHDAASYKPELTVIEENGQRPFGHTWFGGNQSILCSKLAPGYVARSHREILNRGVKLRGAYLDVFSVVPGDECYSPDHPVSRADSLRYRGQSFDMIRAMEGVVSSEEPCDWAIPHLDLVHHGPFALDPDPGHGPAMGIPIPLFNLVYHDAIILPWSLGKGGWGIPSYDSGLLHALANAGIPYISMNPDAGELDRIRAVCALHQRVGLLEMKRHEFLDTSRRKQRTTFADGTTITVDFDKEGYTIAPPLSAAELDRSLQK